MKPNIFDYFKDQDKPKTVYQMPRVRLTEIPKTNNQPDFDPFAQSEQAPDNRIRLSNILNNLPIIAAPPTAPPDGRIKLQKILSNLPPIGDVTAAPAPIQREVSPQPLLPEIVPPLRAQPGQQSDWLAETSSISTAPIETSETPQTRPRALPEMSANILDNFPIERPRIVDNQPVSDMTGNVAVNPRQSQQTLEKIAQIQNKDYGFQRDENGETLRDENGKKIYAKDRDKTHNVWDVLRSIGIGALQGAGSGNGLGGIIGGAAAGGVAGTLDRNFDNKFQDRIKLGQLQNVYSQQTAAEADDQAYKMRETARQNVIDDNNRAAEVARNNDEVRRAENARKVTRDAQDAENKKLDREAKNIDRLVNLYNRLPSFDPADPANASLVKQMQAAGLPVVKKDAAQNIRFERDYRTGETFQIITDTRSGKETVKALTKADGSPLAPTPQVVISGENSARVADINQQGANSRTAANITSREGIAAANNQAKANALAAKIEASKNGTMKPDTLLRAIQNYANKNYKTLQQAKDDFKAAGFNLDILK
jgi:hypothetical protein